MNKIFDLHCDTPHNIAAKKYNHIKPPELSRQDYLGAVFAHFVYPEAEHPFVDAVKMIASTRTYLDKQKTLQMVKDYHKMDMHKANILLGVEGGHILDSGFGQVEALYDLGVRVFTLTWNNSNGLASSALEADKKGLTRLGKEYIRKMRKYDIVLDMSHASTRTVLDVCDICENMIIASHSCVRKLNPSFLRNIDDHAIRAIHARGGVVGINFSKHHLGKHDVFEHIDYLCQNFDVSCAAIGSDFDGITDPVIRNPVGIRKLEKTLLRKGYHNSAIVKIFSKNFLRVFRKSVKRNT
jgi:membrane dipeptidase